MFVFASRVEEPLLRSTLSVRPLLRELLLITRNVSHSCKIPSDMWVVVKSCFIMQTLMKPPRRTSRIYWFSTTALCSSLIPADASPRSSVAQVPVPATRSLTVKLLGFSSTFLHNGLSTHLKSYFLNIFMECLSLGLSSNWQTIYSSFNKNYY